MNKLAVTAFAEEKPNLFISGNDQEQDWRMTEILVAIVESFLQGKDIDTFSSAEVLDIVGDPEQLDVAQLHRFDPNQYFRFIEVRDRSSKVGRNYVQEVMGKGRSTRIQECKIVSTKGFTRNAKRLAAHERIDLRLLFLDNSPRDQYWFSTNSTILHLKQTRVDRCILRVKIDNDYEDLVSEFPEVSEKLLLVLDNDLSPTLGVPVLAIFEKEVMSREDAENRLFGHIAFDGHFHGNPPITLTFDSPCYFVRVELDRSGIPFADGPRVVPVHAIRFFVSSRMTVFTSQIKARYDYVDAISEELLAQCVFFEFRIKERSYYQVFVQYGFKDGFCKDGCVFFE